MSAPKTAKARAATKAKRAETMKERSLDEVRREVERAASIANVYGKRKRRKDADNAAWLIRLASHMLSVYPMSEGTCNQLSELCSAGWQVLSPPSLTSPAKRWVVVSVDDTGFRHLRCLVELRAHLQGLEQGKGPAAPPSPAKPAPPPAPGWMRTLIDECLKEEGGPCVG